MMTNPFVKFPNQPTDNFFERLGGSTLRKDSTLTFESDFTSTSGWTSTDSRFAINTGQDALIANNDQVTDNLQIGYDLTSISDTAWILDFDLKIVSLTSAGSMWTHIGMFSVNTSVNDDQTQNFLGLILLGENAQGANTNSILLADQQGGSLGGAGILTSGLTLTGTPQYYLRLKRTASNKLTIENYSSSARTGTPSTTVTRTLGDNPQSLRYLKVSNRTVSGSGELNIKIENMKFYNGVTGLSEVGIKQHFIEWFSGKQLPSYWNYHDISGTGTKGMVDDVDGGYFIKSGGGNGTHSKIDFNDKRQYSPVGSNVNWVHKTSRTDNGVIWFTGFGYDKNQNEWSGINHQAVCFSDSDNGVFKLRTENASSYNDTATTISIDTSYHSENIVCRSTGIDLKIDGTTGATNTTALPTVTMQPIFVGAQRGSGSPNAQHNVIYCEAYNT